MCLLEQRGTLPITVKAGSALGCPTAPQPTIRMDPGGCWSMVWELLLTEGRWHIFFLLLEKKLGEMTNPTCMGQLFPLAHRSRGQWCSQGPGRTRLQPLILTTDCPGCALVSSLSLTFGEEFQKGSVLLSNLSVEFSLYF